MTESQAPQTFADLLSALKRRSGQSFESLGRKANISRSTLHRYCSGDSVPPNFGLVERIANVCGATRAESAELYRSWVIADGGADPLPPSRQEAPSAAEESEEILPAGPPRRTLWRRGPRHGRRLVLAAAVAIIVLLAGWSDGIDRGPVAMMPAGGPQQITGPDWAEVPTRVPPTLFGVTVASSTGDMPGFLVGAVRLWDSRTRWAELEPERGRFAWSTLDRLVTGAGRARLPVLLTLGGTPAWASPNGPLGPYDDGSRAAPPDRLTDWDGLVRALVDRYRGRVAAYELWVMGNDPHYYNGRVETLVEMTRRASRIIKGTDAHATVVCPSMGRLWTAQGAAVLRRFAELGGYRYCDAAGVKLHQRTASDPPETMLTLTGEIDRILHEAGIHPPLWNTGTAYDFPLQTPLPQGLAAAYAARFYLVGLYARYARMYFYSWGNAHLPITLQADGGAPTAAANAVARVQQWLRDARITSCGRGAAIGVPANVWRCRFTAPGETRTVYWTDTGSARVAAEPGARGLDRLVGGGTTVHAGDVLTVTQSPVLVRSS